MKQLIKVIILFIVFIPLLNWAAQSQNANRENLKTCQKLTLSDAEKILGQAARLTQSTLENKDNSHKLKCTYTAISKDKMSGKEINLYFMLEETTSDEQAQQIYKAIWQSNKNHAGIEKLNNFGDEGFAQSDPPNFHFVMVRTGKFTVRLKVNRAAETTSFDKLKDLAKKITGQI